MVAFSFSPIREDNVTSSSVTIHSFNRFCPSGGFPAKLQWNWTKWHGHLSYSGLLAVKPTNPLVASSYLSNSKCKVENGNEWAEGRRGFYWAKLFCALHRNVHFYKDIFMLLLQAAFPSISSLSIAAQHTPNKGEAQRTTTARTTKRENGMQDGGEEGKTIKFGYEMEHQPHPHSEGPRSLLLTHCLYDKPVLLLLCALSVSVYCTSLLMPSSTKAIWNNKLR